MAWYDCLIPDNVAQGVKMAFQVSADVAGCIPIPIVGDAIELACEGGAFIAGCCDPKSSFEAELAEAGIRVAIAAVPIPGSSLAKIPAKAAIIAVKEFGSAGANLAINYSNGKLTEATLSEVDKELTERMQKEGKDFNALPEDEKKAARAQEIYVRSLGGMRVVSDDYSKELKPEDVAPPGWKPELPAKMTLADTDKYLAEAMQKNGVDFNGLPEDQKNVMRAGLIDTWAKEGIKTVNDKGEVITGASLVPEGTRTTAPAAEEKPKVTLDFIDEQNRRAFKDSGADFDALSEEDKNKLRAQTVVSMNAQGFTVTDASGKPILPNDLVPEGRQNPVSDLPEGNTRGGTRTVVTTSELAFEAESFFRQQNGIADNVALTADQQAQVNNIKTQVTVNMLNEGYSIVDDKVAAAAKGEGEKIASTDGKAKPGQEPVEEKQKAAGASR